MPLYKALRRRYHSSAGDQTTSPFTLGLSFAELSSLPVISLHIKHDLVRLQRLVPACRFYEAWFDLDLWMSCAQELPTTAIFCVSIIREIMDQIYACPHAMLHNSKPQCCTHIPKNSSAFVDLQASTQMTSGDQQYCNMQPCA
jgi:hypothetical protein